MYLFPFYRFLLYYPYLNITRRHSNIIYSGVKCTGHINSSSVMYVHLLVSQERRRAHPSFMFNSLYCEWLTGSASEPRVVSEGGIYRVVPKRTVVATCDWLNSKAVGLGSYAPLAVKLYSIFEYSWNKQQ